MLIDNNRGTMQLPIKK